MVVALQTERVFNRILLEFNCFWHRVEEVDVLGLRYFNVCCEPAQETRAFIEWIKIPTSFWSGGIYRTRRGARWRTRRWSPVLCLYHFLLAAFLRICRDFLRRFAGLARHCALSAYILLRLHFSLVHGVAKEILGANCQQICLQVFILQVHLILRACLALVAFYYWALWLEHASQLILGRTVLVHAADSGVRSIHSRHRPIMDQFPMHKFII